MHRTILVVAISLLTCGTASATCKSEASDKKLAGAALTSFMTKCETDAKAKCDADSTQRKLAGAAKNSRTKKCVSDAVGL
jgi:hypothetical protein